MFNWLMCWLDLFRIRQWYKNLVFFAAAFFSKQILDPSTWPILLFGFILLSLLSSGAYAINDWRDVKFDKLHPNKKNRPLVSGRVSLLSGLLSGLLLMSLSLYLSYLYLPAIFSQLTLLALLMLAYTFIIKRIWLADVVLIASNFLLRADAGAAVLGVLVSPWFVLGIFAVGLFLALRKRLIDLGKSASRSPYKPADKFLIHNLLSLSLVFLLIVYSLFTFQSPASNHLLLLFSIPFVFFIALRYYGSILRGSGMAEDPLAPILSDRVLLLALGALALLLTLAYYF